VLCVGFLTCFSVSDLWALTVHPGTPDQICIRIAELCNAATGVTLPTKPSDVIKAFVVNYDLVSEVCKICHLFVMSSLAGQGQWHTQHAEQGAGDGRCTAYRLHGNPCAE
jgi:hypothetical protein